MYVPKKDQTHAVNREVLVLKSTYTLKWLEGRLLPSLTARKILSIQSMEDKNNKISCLILSNLSCLYT